MFTFTVRRWFTSLFVLLGLIGGALPASAQVVYTLNGPAQASFCDTLVLTSRFQNSGGTLAGLVITQQLPHGSFVYVPSNSVVTLPDGSVLTNAAAEPTVLSGGQTLVWDFSSLVTSSTLTRPLITEVFYDPTNTLEDAYEWIELYNPTLGPIGLTNWSIRDAAPGQIDTLPTFTMAPGQFVIIAATTNAFYEQFPGYTGAVYQVADGKLGSGLNNFADGLTLRDQVAANVDAVSYGGSTAAFNPPVSLVSDGQSIQRNPANVDSNTRSDWQALATPGPGAGSIQSGIGAGGVVQIVYQVEVACGSPAGQFVGSASFQQPPSAPASTVQALRFVTVNDGDLTVTKTPSVTDAGVGDPISWLVTVKNEGFGNAPNVRISDTLGVGLAFTGFSVAPTNAGPYGSSVAWDATVIPALTNLTAGQAVTVRVDAVVVSCSNLFNSADANWGCPPMKAVTNTACENTALLGETAGAAIHFLDRYPAVSARLLPASPISIDYCSGSPLTLVVSNASGAAVGIASVTRFTPTLPAGWSISGGSVVSGQVVVGTLAPGQSSNVTFTLTPGGACPLATSPQLLGLLGAFVDPCGNIFAGPALYTQVQIGNRPGATVSKQMPTSVNATSGIIPVAIFYAYSNLTATTVTFSDAYPVSPNLSPVSISGGGVLNTSLHTITWTDTLTGSGVVTQTFNLAIGTVCGGPNGQFFNTILAPNFVDCRGCTVSVGGNGRVYPTSLNTGTNCPGGGGTGGCFVATSKSAPTAMQEICEPVVVTQRFSAFNGTSLQTNWNGVLFTSDLAGGQGRLTSTSSVQVFIGASNVTPYVSIVTTSPALTLALSNLNDSIFAQPTNVIGTMEVRWGLTVTNAGQVGDSSSLAITPCAPPGQTVFWDVGGSGLDIVLYPQFTANACGILEGRIDLSQWLSPSNGLTPRVFPDYDVQVELNLDADASGVATFVYEAGSTAFSNFVALGGAALPSAEPSVVSNRVTWDLGDLATNGVGSIHYRFRATCSKEANESHVARVRFNDRCGDGLTNRQFSATSATNILPTLLTANLVLSLKPETTYISSTNVVVTMEFLNSGAGPAYNVRPELVLPTNVAYRTSSVPAFSVSGTSVVWTLAYATPVGGLLDLDADGFFDDLPAGGSFQLFVTNSLLSCGDPTLRLRGSHGCGGSACQTPAEDASVFIPLAGSLVVRTTFPDDGIVCKTNTVSISVRNSGLTVDRLVQITEAIPAGISYVAGSSRYSFNGGTTNNIADPGITSPLTYSSALIPELLALDPGDEVTLLLDVYVDCNGVAGGGQFLATGRYTDLCGDTITNEVVLSVLPTRSPVLSLVKEARNLDGVQSNFVSGVIVADVGDRVVYRITVGHIPASQTPVQYMQLVDRLPTQYTFTAASPAPSSVSSNILTWNNATLMALAGGSPYTNTASAFTIFVTGTVISCTSVGDNIAQINYGCSTDCMVFAAGDSHVFSSESELSAGATSSLDLGACGGTKTLQVVNNGSTARGLVVTNVAPPGYVFTTASVTGEFNSAGLTLQLSGSPSGSVAVVNFSSAAASGAVDLNDDAADGLAALDLGYLESFTMTLNLVSDGSTLDGVANPNDLDYADPEPAGPANKSSLATVVLSNLCGSAAAISSTVSDIPELPDLDIDLQPNSLLVTNNQLVFFTNTVINASEGGLAENIHIRLRFGTGWTNLTLVSSNIISSGTSTLITELQGSSNVLVSLPGVILDPIDDRVVLVFSAVAVQGPGVLDATAEVVGQCLEAITTNLAYSPVPFADSMTGSVVGAVNGRYYSYDQDRTFGLGTP